MIRFFLFLFLSLQLLLSCSKTMVPIEEPDGGDTLNSLAKRLAWVTPTMSDTSEMSIKRVAANQDKVVCVRSKDGFENTVFAMDVKTGKIMWEWGDPNVPSGSFITSLIIKDDLVIVELWADIYILDLNTGRPNKMAKHCI